MYSGTTFSKTSGNIIGVHQRIDRLARRNLAKLIVDDDDFPSAKEIIAFEGNNGPDGIKRKNPGVDEPWHFIDPRNPDDRAILGAIDQHYRGLVNALKHQDRVKASFEASWLAHTVVDGLTPAHHYPLADKIEELWGKPHTERQSKFAKNFIKGHSLRDTASKNWQYWGAKGVFSTHIFFEMGIASSIAGLRFTESMPIDEEIIAVKEQGVKTTFLEVVDYIYGLDMYQRFWKDGWTTRLAQMAKRELIPITIWYLTIVWYLAYQEAFDEN